MSELLFHRRVRRSDVPAEVSQVNQPFSEYRTTIKQEYPHERQLSPWSSEEFRMAKQPNKQFQTLRMDKHSPTGSKEVSRSHRLNPIKGRSVELGPLRNHPQKISKDFFNLLKNQKKDTCQKQYSSKIQISTIEMSLNITASVQQQKTKQAYYIPADLGSTQSTHRETFKDQQPVKVKITKKLMERYKNNEEDDLRPQTYRDHFCQSLNYESGDRYEKTAEKKVKNQRQSKRTNEHNSERMDLTESKGGREEPMVLRGSPMRVTFRSKNQKKSPFRSQQMNEGLLSSEHYFFKY